MYLPARRGRLSDDAAEQIRNRVAEWGLKPGDRLPPERELAVRLGVGRTSVREGLRALELSGFVDVVPSKGVYLKEDAAGQLDRLVTSWLTADRGGTLELIELRPTLEGQTAALAAARATPVELATIERAVTAMRAEAGAGAGTHTGARPETGNLAAFSAQDVAFHDAIARASRNGLLRRALAAITRETEAQAAAAAASGQPARDEAVADHAAILDAIRARDEARAREAMGRHVMRIAEDLGVGDGDPSQRAVEDPVGQGA